MKYLLLLFCLGMTMSATPHYLYKVLSLTQWEASQGSKNIVLNQDDRDFIHFSTEEQLERLISKYWKAKSFVVLKLKSDQLPGKMLYEANPGGTNKYYHLYDGEIPFVAIVRE
jgi:uncharacterized protein (DUF952 family)